MKFDRNLLNTYRTLLQTTELQKSYQEFVALFRFLRIRLAELMPEYKFQGNIVENAMDYSYFQFTDEELKAAGLKIAVVFVHADFRFEVWLSGVNRKVQRKYYEQLKDCELAYELTDNPERKDYILRCPIDDGFDISDGEAAAEEIRKAAVEMIRYAEDIKYIGALKTGSFVIR